MFKKKERSGFGRFGAAAVAAALLVLSAGAVPGRAGVLDGLLKDRPEKAAKKAGVVETASAVSIPLSSLDSGKALFLKLSQGGTDYHYFAIRSADGVYRAALDACDVCFREAKGYRQDGPALVCNNCDMKFAPEKLGAAKGGCNPHALAARVEGRSLVIDRAEITAGKRLFPRKRAS